MWKGVLGLCGLLVLTCLTTLDGVGALTCDLCNGTRGSTCDDRYPPSTGSVSQCTGQTCFKQKLTESSGGATVYVGRGCYAMFVSPDQCVKSTVSRQELVVCTCSTNYCNSGRPVHATSLIGRVLLPAVTVLLSVRLGCAA